MDAERSLTQARRQEMKRAARHESRLASGDGHDDGGAEQGAVDDEEAEAEARAERALAIQRRQAAKKALQVCVCVCVCACVCVCVRVCACESLV